MTRTFPQNYRLVLGPLAYLLKSSPISLRYFRYEKFFRHSREFIVCCYTSRFSNIPGTPRYGVTHRLPWQWRGTSPQTCTSSGASSTDSPLSPTLLIDTPDTLLTSQGLFASQDAFQVIGQLCISSPDVHGCTRPSTKTKRYQQPSHWEQSQDQLFTEDEPDPTKLQRTKSNIRDYSTKLDKFKLFLAVSKLKREAAVKRLHDPKSLLHNPRPDTQYKHILPSQRNNINPRNHGSRNQALRCAWPQAKLHRR